MEYKQIQVHLILKINIKISMFDLKFLQVLKMVICSMTQEHWIQPATAVHRCNKHELQGFASLLTLSPSRPTITNPEHCLAYDASLQSLVPVNLN